MSELINTLFVFIMDTPYAQYGTIVAMVCYLLTHVVAVLPESVTSKIPNVVMQIINAVAGNYKQAENLKTDSKGNLR